jgi:membrane protease subunit HflC
MILIFMTVVVLFIGWNSVYVMEAGDQVVMTQFGRITGEAKTKPGIYFKMPFVQQANFISKAVQSVQTRQKIPTIRKRYILIESRWYWQIVDPVVYFKTLNNHQVAGRYISDRAAVVERKIISSSSIADLIRKGTDPQAFKNAAGNPRVEKKIKTELDKQVSGTGIVLLNLETTFTYPAKK